ncbi:phosphocholine cytidylyltransferase family protein [Campylobacter sp. MIT 97-5078]|uniref:phosphocholine cytidylyltransferase family protein n=1 Tax=Campylobacter sp. MIT 97-5078 TaxID=1548153 RepID=UPI0005129C78|nr:phosphocholine cytidylyltransferase family protein [Campylobacter sp. MIT 97-5078]KGI55311.1 sugar nucleotidyltransferase [Campylobacter sp. MIT 97-5078]TQR27897.1 phosphocholine cytidylyltransferase family protein [Campylobacter sp. MIT 97-5078]
MKALILAAGFGSRLMPLTQDKPKTMVDYKNKSLIEYEISALKEARIDEIAVVGGYKFEVLKDFVSKKFKFDTFFENKNYASTNMLHSLFSARAFLQSCISEKKDLIISYADIVYFKDSVQALKQAKGELCICVDLNWQKLWEARFDDILSDAETLKFDGEFIKELGKKPKSLAEIEAQYMGLFKISYDFLPSFIEFFDSLDKNALYDGQAYNNIYMTSFLQGLIDKFHNAKAVKLKGNWCEIDFKSDLELDIKDFLC